MKKTVYRFSSRGLLIAFLSASALSGRAQAFAYEAPAQKAAGKAPASAAPSIQEALQLLGTHYQADILFSDQLVKDDQAPASAIDFNQSLEKNLTAVLKPARLKFRKAKDGSYLITRELPQKKRVPAPAAAAGSAGPGQPAAVAVRTITGKVRSKNGEGLPGVSVILKGTTTGTSTNPDGSFSLSVPDNGGTLVFSFIGFIPKEVAIPQSGSVLDVTLEEDVKALEEVVVVGYGVQKKSDLTGAVASVSAEALQERPAASLNQALSGRMPGVNVSTNSGRPGGKANIRIRGNTSVSVANDPLYVVDGVILVASELAKNSSPIDYINPNDIASIEVLKDASSTAIYGARGANGVIIVTTKRGNQNGGIISYNSNFNISTLARKIPLLNAREFLMVEDGAYLNAEKYDPDGWAKGKYKDPKLKRTNPLLFDANGSPLYDTDWQEAVTRKAFTQNHQLSFTGGNNKASYGAFVGYLDEEGIMKESWLKRFSGRFVFDSQLKDWFKVGGSLSYNDQHERHIENSWVGRNMVEGLPIVPVKHPDGSWGSNLDYPGMEGGPNAVQVGEEYRNYLKTITALGNLYTNITLAQGLELRTTLGVNNINQRISTYGGRNLNFISLNQKGEATLTTDQHSSWQFENYLTYQKNLQVHSFTGLLGASWQHVDRFNFNAGTQNFADDFFGFNNLSAGSVNMPPSSRASGYGLNSYFGRFNYKLKEKYLLTFTGRVDGSSKFGEDNRYAFFPSAALAWRISEEDFIKNIPLISNLKMRTSYGVTGNSEIAAYQALPGLGNYSYILNGTTAIGTGILRLANPILQWEKTRQVDLGVELGLFNGKVSVEADVYRKITTDMLLNSPVPTSSGYATVTKNIGSMENKGVEVALKTHNIEKADFAWETAFNISINKNKVTALSGGSDIYSGKTVIRVGEPVGSFFGYVHLGTWATGEESEAAKFYALPGDIKILDRNQDGKINLADRTIIGKGIPDGFGTLANTFRYKNLELLVDLQYQYGNDVMWVAQRPQENRQGIANSHATVLNAWTPKNQNTPIAQWRPVAAGYDNLDTSHMIQDGSFIRGRNLLLGYNFGQQTANRLKMSRLKVYTSVQNFFVATRFQGYDPESQTSNTPFGQGEVNYDEYPKARVFMLGLNASF